MSSFPNSTPTVLQLLHSLNLGGAEVLAARLGRRLGGRFRFVFACLDGLGPLGKSCRRKALPYMSWDAARGWTGGASAGCGG